MRTVLVRLPGGEGIVRRDDGEIALTTDVRGDGGQGLHEGDRYRPISAWLDDDHCLVGGLLAPGAAAAEVIDDRGTRVRAQVGGGAYVAILTQRMDGREAVVCCRDGTGSVIRRPLPAAYPCTPVDDADEPCPACGAIAYDECAPTERWRGGRPGPDGTTIPNPIVVCRVCGHEESEPTFFGLHVPCDDTEDEAARAARLARVEAHARAQRWYSDTLTLRAVSFPIYAAEGWPARIGTSGSQRDRLTSLTICHFDVPDADPYAGASSRLEITTSDDTQPGVELGLAREALYGWVQGDGANWPEASPAARSLWLAARERRIRAQVLLASVSEQLITIDGAPHPFLVLTASTGRWVAARCHDDLAVTIAGRDLDATTLTVEPIADPAARLLGPEPPDPEA